MDKFKRLLRVILLPHLVVIVLLLPFSIVGLIYSLSHKDALPIIQYSSYLISAYTLTVICIRMPQFVKRIKELSNRNQHIKRYKNDLNLRIKVSLCFGVGVNLLYSTFNLMLGIINRSVWFYSLSAYYFLLCVMRSSLLKDAQSETKLSTQKQWVRYRFCGIVLIGMNIVLSAIVFYVVYQNKGFTYHYIHTIAMAAYTFTVTVLAIINVIRYRKCEKPIVSAVKYVNMTAALVSILSLETAMLNAFGKESDEAFRWIMTSCTGAGVCLSVLAIGVYMVVKSAKELKNDNGDNYGAKNR